MANSALKTEKTSSGNSIGLPVLIETVFTLTKLTVVLVGIIVVVVTMVNGNPYWVALIRGGITVLTLGLLGWFITWISTKGIIESVRGMLKEADKGESGNSMDTKA